MKHSIFNLLRVMLIFVATFATTLAFAQDLPSSPEETTHSFMEYVFTFTIFLAVVPFVVELIKKIVKPTKGGINLLISWLTGVVIAILCFVFDIGVFKDFTLFQAVVTGFGASLATNGVYDSGFVNLVLKFLKGDGESK